MSAIKELCKTAPVIPVIVIDRVEDAAPLAEALVAGGLPLLEITLRTEAALPAIEAMAKACPDAHVGAGTLRKPSDVQACIDAGASFGVSPGAPTALMDAVAAAEFPFLPGCATATEAMELADRGYDMLKFFPASAAGGPGLLKSLASPLAGIDFCPTGGVSLDNAAEWLSLPNVVTVGGSWLCPKDMVTSGDWTGITNLARQASEKFGSL